MGDINTTLFAALAKEQPQFDIVKDKNLDVGDTVFDQSESVKKDIQTFKDALFTVVMLRARNYMVATKQDDRSADERMAMVDFTLTLSDRSFRHLNEDQKERKSKAELLIIPDLQASLLDTLGDVDLSEFVRKFNEFLLPCK